MKPATRWFDESFAPVPRFYERFARQQRFGLPSEFPLTSPYPGIDHHLSGPNITTRPGILDRRRIARVYCPRLSLSMVLAEEVKFIQDMSKRLSISQLGQRYASYLHSRQKVLPKGTFKARQNVRLLGPCFKTGERYIRNTTASVKKFRNDAALRLM